MSLQDTAACLLLKKLNLQIVPAIRYQGLTENQKKALRIADNKVAESEWDYKELRVDLEHLDTHNFDLNLTGFGEDEWENVLVPESNYSNEPNKEKEEEQLIQCPKCKHPFNLKDTEVK